MTALLIRLFVRDRNNVTDPRVRSRYGALSGIVGIVMNILLFAAKLMIGMLTASVSIQADAFNNLSDAGSSVISLISFRISAKPADRDHPFGHARMEYVASMIVSFLILLVGAELLKSSVTKIFSGVSRDAFSWIAVLVLGLSVAAKLWLGLFNYRLGKKISSPVMKATATDSLSDAISTAAVLAATLVWRFTSFDPDAYVGAAVALLILISGLRILNETKNKILGEAPVKEVEESIRSLIAGYPAVLGVHDLLIHNYGAGHTIASLHVEVDGKANIFDTHDVIDNIERRINSELGILCTIHMDPIVTDDRQTAQWKQQVTELVSGAYPGASVHDFRVVTGATHTNLIFDVALPFEIREPEKKIREHIQQLVNRDMGPNYFTVITVDHA